MISSSTDAGERFASALDRLGCQPLPVFGNPGGRDVAKAVRAGDGQEAADKLPVALGCTRLELWLGMSPVLGDEFGPQHVRLVYMWLAVLRACGLARMQGR